MSRMETCVDILLAIGTSAKKTARITYKVVLTWRTLQRYIRDLLKQGLIVSDTEEGKKIYRLSIKGFRMLNEFHSIRENL